MQMTPIILFGLALLAYAVIRRPDRIKPEWLPHLKGWQKLLGVVAFILAVLIIINPEFLALGLLGDTAFFDVLVLLLSLQLQMAGTRTWRCIRAGFSRMMPVMIPRLSLSCSMMVLVFAPVGDAVSAIQKTVHRIFS